MSSAQHSHNASLLRKPLNEEEAGKEMRKMTAFILQEAAEKATEIKVRADEEFNMEKAKIFRFEKLSIEDNYHKKLKALETKKKMYYSLLTFRSHSHALNSSRIKVLSFKENIIMDMVNEVKCDISFELENPEKRNIFLKSLIDQSCRFLQSENHGSIVCLEEDRELIHEVISVATQMNFTLHKDLHLFKEKDIGGIVIVVQKGNIQCNNTLAQRLELATKEGMPLIRNILFGDLKN